MDYNDLSKELDIPREYLTLQLEKRKIANTIRETLKERDLTYRQACANIDNFSYAQLTRVTSGSNYTIDTLLKTLDSLGLELNIREKDSNDR